MNPFHCSCIAAASALIAGMLVLALFGPALPPLISAMILMLVSGLALAAGFGLWYPRLPAWTLLPPVRGAICVVIGVGAMFVPANFIVSAFFLGLGSRVVWLAALELENVPRSATQEAGDTTTLALTAAGGIERFQNAPPATIVECLPRDSVAFDE